MPPRLSRASVSAPKPNNARKKHQKRTLEAFSIASHAVPENSKFRQHRLGETEGDEPRRKRARFDDDEDDDEDDEDGPSNGHKTQKKRAEKGRFDELDLSGGSDSEGHEWRMGEVDEDDDSEIDSDEAFGESDEERFEGFVFRGSSSGKHKKQNGKIRRNAGKVVEGEEGEEVNIDLNEGEDEDMDDEDADSFGEEGVDLATMLDEPYSDSEDDENGEKEGRPSKEMSKLKARGHGDDDEEPSEEDDFGEDGFSDLEMSGTESDKRALAAAKLKNLISSLHPEDQSLVKQKRTADAHESSAPSEFGVTSQQKLSLDDLLGTVTDPTLRKSLKLLKDDSKTSRRHGIPGKLEAPLPKRQQDRLDRVSANKKTNETLERWVDTVKHNRRAEHLSFPLVDPEAAEPLGAKQFLPTSSTVPLTDLESAIQNILEESGLTTANGKSGEEQIRAFEELQTNKLPLEEVIARRADLRKQRELLFREEIRAKRIKKIKSKAYRRVHRKERERNAERERDLLIAEGVDVSENEREYNDRRRAEERMGAKHRESKWAKGMKASGRAVWDEDARAGVTEMARRNEELRRRMEGKDVRPEEDDDTDISSSEEGTEGDEEDKNEGETSRIQRKLNQVDKYGAGDSSTKLGSMLFMQRAEAARKARNDEDIERMRRELAEADGEEPQEIEPEVASLGRRKFGPNTVKKSKSTPKIQQSEFEERLDPEDKDNGDDNDDAADSEDVEITLDGNSSIKASRNRSNQKDTRKKLSRPLIENTATEAAAEEINPWIEGPKSKGPNNSSSKGKKTEVLNGAATVAGAKSKKTISGAPIADDSTKRLKQASRSEASDTDGWTVVTYANQTSNEDNSSADDSSSESDEVYNPLALGNDPLIAKAFAGDSVVASFDAEKAATIAAEDDQVVDETLPGWGSWTGADISKRERKRNQAASKRFLTVQPGLAPDKRKDAKLDKVIINEKRVKKNVKFMASELPFPFESREQYERSLRLPKGKEWTTKSVYQQGTKPRVLVKKGVVVEPMEKPLV